MEVSQGLQATAPFWGVLSTAMPQLLHVCPSVAAQEREGESLNTSRSYNEHNVALDKPARARGANPRCWGPTSMTWTGRSDWKKP